MLVTLNNIDFIYITDANHVGMQISCRLCNLVAKEMRCYYYMCYVSWVWSTWCYLQASYIYGLVLTCFLSDLELAPCFLSVI